MKARKIEWKFIQESGGGLEAIQSQREGTSFICQMLLKRRFPPPRKRAESTNARLDSGPPLRKRVCDPIGTDKEKESARWMKSSHHLREISVAIVGTKRFSFVMNLSRPVSRGIDPFAGKRYQR